MKKWVIFDVMGVVFEVGDDTNKLLVPYIKNLNSSITAEQINKLYIDASLGKIKSSTFWKKLGFKDSYLALEKNYLDQKLTLDKEFCATAERLQASYNLALLSNDLNEWSMYLRQMYDLNRLVKEVVISGDVGIRKPSAAIYELILQRLKCKPDECVFIDDRPKNLVPAMNLGMRVIRFRRETSAINEYSGYEIKSFSELPSLLSRMFA